MLSNLIVTTQRLVVILDDIGQENISQKFLTQLLKEQGEDGFIKTFPLNGQSDAINSLQKFLAESCNGKLSECKKWNIILPNLSDWLAYQKPCEVFGCLNKLKKNENTKRTLLWISKQHLNDEHGLFLIAACEYMADIVLNLHTDKELTILTRKSGGGVTNNRYTYTKTKNEFMVQLKKPEAVSKNVCGTETDGEKKEQIGTFKIELDEEEMMARNAMKMPYEKALEATESNIIYTPDAADDFDDEDPDEDLNI
ncbi:elongator complex protein 5 [Musca vetustissima]|uniref:elongator complex protein 5 n=1 Tax=Musca vetustissima TaxID=27455 RepID=UPI002AB64121|nr:elongator complex protein 5 [Musca vetustissima]